MGMSSDYLDVARLNSSFLRIGSKIFVNEFKQFNSCFFITNLTLLENLFT